MGTERGRGKPPDHGPLISDEQKDKIARERLKIHRMCEPLFGLVKKITEPGAQTVIRDTLAEINKTVLSIHEARRAKQSGIDKKLQAESLISDLKSKISEFRQKEIDEKDKETMQEIEVYTETILLSHIRQIRTKDF